MYYATFQEGQLLSEWWNFYQSACGQWWDHREWGTAWVTAHLCSQICPDHSCTAHTPSPHPSRGNIVMEWAEILVNIKILVPGPNLVQAIQNPFWKFYETSVILQALVQFRQLRTVENFTLLAVIPPLVAVVLETVEHVQISEHLKTNQQH